MVKGKRGALLNVRVEPRSSRTEVTAAPDGLLKVKLTAPPVGGAANKQLIEVLSEYFGVKKSAVRIVRGGASRNKVVEIEGL